MKTKILLLVLLGLVSTSFAQWQMVDSSKTNIINDFVIGGKYLFIAGGKYVITTGILKRSSDDGATWQTITNGLSEVKTNNQIAGNGEEFYLQSFGQSTVGSGAIFRSIDGGLSWTKVSSGIAAYQSMELLFDGTTLLALLNNEYYISVDNGKTWTSKSKITSNASLKGLLLAGNRYFSYSPALNGYYYSDDKCASWKLSSSPNTFMTSASTDGNNFYIIANDANQTPYIATNQGSLINGKPVGGTAYSVDRIAGVGNAVFVSGLVLSNYIYLSTDQLKTWKDVSAGIPLKDYHIEKILIKENYIYLAMNSLFINQPSYQIWRRKLSDFGISTDVRETKELPTTFELKQNYPNPFNPETTINYKLQAAGNVSLKVYDVLGNEVATLVNDYLQAGNYNSQFAIRNSKLSSGVYFYTMKANGFVATKKMILMK